MICPAPAADPDARLTIKRNRKDLWPVGPPTPTEDTHVTKKNDPTQPTAGDIPLDGHLDDFARWLEDRGCLESTRSLYLGVCRKFGRYLDSHDVEVASLHDGHLEAFLKQIKPQRGSRAASERYHACGIRALLDYLHQAGVCPTPIDSYLDGYTTWLQERGHTILTIAQYVSTCHRFGRYLRRNGIGLTGLAESDIDVFVETLAIKRLRRDRATREKALRRQIRLFLDYLRLMGACPLARSPIKQSDPALVSEYLTFCRNHRGLTEGNIQQHRVHLVRFLAHVGIEGTPEQLRSLSVRHADEYLIDASRGRKRTTMSHICGILRGFCAFLHLRGVITIDLSTQISTPRIYQLEGLPRSVPWSDVERTLSAVNRDTLVGRRDYAILILLSYCGLRASEVSSLRLDGLDWRNDVLHIRRAKSHVPDTLPLLPIVGEALIDYLTARPALPYPEVFLKVIAPAGPISAPSVSWLARKYLRTAGVKAPLLGAHTLRHAQAVRLVRAGFPLKTIGDTLGHRSPQSTFIYTKVPTEDLRSVALDISEVQP